MNSWSMLCWPTLMSILSSNNFCWYQSSQSRVAGSASILLTDCKTKRSSVLKLRPWICRPLTLKRPPFQPKAFCVSICSVPVVWPSYSKPWRRPPERLPRTSLCSCRVSVTPNLASAGRKPPMSPNKLDPEPRPLSAPKGPPAGAALVELPVSVVAPLGAGAAAESADAAEVHRTAAKEALQSDSRRLHLSVILSEYDRLRVNTTPSFEGACPLQ